MGFATIILVIGVGTAPAAGQSILGGTGLGSPAEPLDARSRALGGVGIGLSGWQILGTDPAVSAGLFIPSITATVQMGTTTLGDGSEAGQTRFPTVGMSYPYRNNVFFAQLGGFLDQEWVVRSRTTIQLGDGPVEVEDQLSSNGGIGQVRVGWSRRLTESVAVGATVGSYVGTVERTFQRVFGEGEVGIGVEPYTTNARWRASGKNLGAGVVWDPSSLIRLSGSVGWSEDLRLSPVGSGVDEAGRYSIPIAFRGGGTLTLVPGMSLMFGVSYADWSDTGADLNHGSTRDATWGVGGGMELLRLSVMGRPAPLRLGMRHQLLPFDFQGDELSERTYSGGIGINLEDVDTQPLARLEFGVERGERIAGSASERFWRTTISLRLAGG